MSKSVVFTTKLRGREKIGAMLLKCPLFGGFSATDLGTLLDCIAPRKKKYGKSAFVFMEDDALDSIGIVLSGVLHIVRDDYWGNRAIVARLETGSLFGESFAAAQVAHLPVSVVAAEEAELLLFDFNRIMHSCSAACAFHERLIKNMVLNIAQNNIRLMEKIECLAQRTTRSKILTYLSGLAKSRKGGSMEIPFDRQELADYLSVERSALSACLGRMREEGILEFNKNRFRLPRGDKT